MIEIRFFNDKNVDDLGYLGRVLRSLDGIGKSPVVKTERELTSKKVTVRLLDGDNNYNLKADVDTVLVDSIISKLESKGFTHMETVEVEQDTSQ